MSKGSLVRDKEQQKERPPAPSRPSLHPHPFSVGSVAQCPIQNIKTHFLTIILGWSGRATQGFLSYQKKNLSFLGIAII